MWLKERVLHYKHTKNSSILFSCKFPVSISCQITVSYSSSYMFEFTYCVSIIDTVFFGSIARVRRFEREKRTAAIDWSGYFYVYFLGEKEIRKWKSYYAIGIDYGRISSVYRQNRYGCRIGRKWRQLDFSLLEVYLYAALELSIFGKVKKTVNYIANTIWCAGQS